MPTPEIRAMASCPAMRLAVLALALWACGDNVTPAPDALAPATDLLVKLRALPNVHDADEKPTQTAGYHYIVLHFTQPVDHADPASPTFLQEVSLLHKDEAAPLIVHTSGYWDYYLDSPVELTQLLDANQISIEHRYFASSRPANPDWSKLTIQQMADDEHAIVSALRTIYTGKALSTGGSKGGMTAIFYRRFFPDDVDGSVPYVAPISYAAPDTRYPPFIDTVGTDGHRLAVWYCQNANGRSSTAVSSTASAPTSAYVAVCSAMRSSIVVRRSSTSRWRSRSACRQLSSPSVAMRSS
jgi:hypothetical protein